MGLLQFALGLSRTKGESPKDSYSPKQRQNPDHNQNMLHDLKQFCIFLKIIVGTSQFRNYLPFRLYNQVLLYHKNYST